MKAEYIAIAVIIFNSLVILLTINVVRLSLGFLSNCNVSVDKLNAKSRKSNNVS